eukprot:TRINITY_DN54482_c0_g1_i1.p1 TRINITY_DN54482_c0_g1~~TRINITY_DN54482_c0_g1_i1.p1  ORF type:complete len:305 (-),score=33.49 TRINITY_DN54482_c0_g1_i1:433-1347(-)
MMKVYRLILLAATAVLCILTVKRFSLVIGQHELHRTEEESLFVMTALSRPYRKYCDMLESAAHNGIQVHILGWGDRNYRGWDDNTRKLVHALRAMSTLREDQIVMMVDGGDMLFNGSPTDIVRAFRVLDRSIVFGAERVCWAKALPPETCKDWPEHYSPYRWLNAGGHIGRVGALRRLTLYAMGKMNVTTCDKCDDQAIMTRAWLKEGWNTTILLDYYQTIFQNLLLAEEDFCPYNRGSGSRLRNCRTGSTPLVYHFNGNPRKPSFEEIHGKMWWDGRNVPVDSLMWINGKATTLGKLCPFHGR